MNRRNFDSTGHINNTLGDYPAAVRETAKEENVALIDLNAMSKIMYESWGPEKSVKAFVHYPANTFRGRIKSWKTIRILILMVLMKFADVLYKG